MRLCLVAINSSDAHRFRPRTNKFDGGKVRVLGEITRGGVGALMCFLELEPPRSVPQQS